MRGQQTWNDQKDAKLQNIVAAKLFTQPFDHFEHSFINHVAFFSLIWRNLILKVCCFDAKLKTLFSICFNMDKVINLGIPHVGELIFESIDTPGLIQCVLVSETWKVLAENVLIKRWKGKMFEACKKGEMKIVQLLLERCNAEESGLNIKDEYGWTAFMEACYNGHKDVVKLFLEHSERIDLNARDNFGETAFMIACQYGDKDVVKLLLKYSKVVDINISKSIHMPKRIKDLLKKYCWTKD